MRKLLYAILFLALPAFGQMTGTLGSISPAVPLTNLKHAWLVNGTPATVPDIYAGTAPFTTLSGTLQGAAVPGVNTNNASNILPTSGNFYGSQGVQYNVSSATGIVYGLASAATMTWGDGNPHTEFFVGSLNPYEWSSGGSQITSFTPFDKINEWYLEYSATAGGLIKLCWGTGGATCVSANAYPATANRFSGLTGATVNSVFGNYLIRITYDGSSSICIGINDGALSCTTGVTITTSATAVRITAPMGVEAIFDYGAVEKSSNDTSPGCGGPFSTTPCVTDVLYNTFVQNKYPWYQQANPTYLKTLQVNGSSNLGSAGWGTAYTTYQSGTQLTPTYYVENPYATFSVTTNAPALYFDEVVLNGVTTYGQSQSAVAVYVDGTFSGFAYAQATGGVAAGNNRVVFPLPADGNSHTVVFTAGGYVQYSGSDTTPYANMASMEVNTVGVIGNYTLTANAPSNANVFLLDADSIGLAYQTDYPPTDSWATKLAVSGGGGRVGTVIREGMGGAALYHNIGCNPGAGGGSSTTCTSTAWTNGSVSNTNSLTPAAYANLLKTRYGCPKYYWVQKQVNDQGRSLWYSTDAAIAMGYFWTQWNSICPATINYQASAAYKGGETTPNAKGEYSVHYSQAGAALTPNWQVNLAAACTAAPSSSCTNVDISGTSATGTAANTSGFPVYGDSTYGSCATYPGGPAVANSAYYSDTLHFQTCGEQMMYYAIFHYTLGWI